MTTRQLLAFACVFSSPLAAAEITERPSESAAIADTVQLHIARNGNEVLIAWALPNLTISQFEICRHIQQDPKGRDRVATVRPKPAIFLDQVPNLETAYWYWLKITLDSGQVLNVGPVATPAPIVWTP